MSQSPARERLRPSTPQGTPSAVKIESIESFRVRIPLIPQRRMVSSLGRHEVSDFLLVRVRTESGLVGAGEATVTPRWSGETVWGAQLLVDRVLGPSVIGLDAADISELHRRLDSACYHNWFTKAAIEMACWDIQGKAAGKPLYELLGGAVRPRKVKSRFSLGAYSPDVAASRAAELVQAGFDTIKVKVGGLAEEDLARVRAVREAIGPRPDLVIDANCGWDADTAIHCIRALEECRLVLVEQPTPDGDYAAMARVRKAIQPPVMADDACFNLIHAQELIRNECCDVLSLYPGKNGGIAKSLAIARLAAEHGIACTIGSNLEWDVATAAMGHLVVACENFQVERLPGDMLGPSYHELRIVKNPLHIEGPFTTIPDSPGLGVDVDWDLVAVNPCP